MNWAGNWSGSVTYFKNDVAFDTVAQSSYVLLATSKTGGSRPGSDPTNWQRLSPSAGGGDITGVLTPGGSGLSGGATSGDVTLQNTGVLELTQGTGITISGTKANYTIASSGVANANPGVSSVVLGSNFPLLSTATNNVLTLAFNTTVASAKVAVFYNFTIINTNATNSYTVYLSTTTSPGTAAQIVNFEPSFHIPANLAGSGLTQTNVTCSGTLLFTCGAIGAQYVTFVLTPTTNPAGALTVAGPSGSIYTTLIQAYGPVTQI